MTKKDKIHVSNKNEITKDNSEFMINHASKFIEENEVNNFIYFISDDDDRNEYDNEDDNEDDNRDVDT